MQINSLPAEGAVVEVESAVSPVKLYTKQSYTHKRCFIRQDEIWNEKDIQKILKTVGFHQKHCDLN